jgi:uncharacterized protein DUF2630
MDEGNLSRIAALIDEKRRVRVQIALGSIDAETAEARLKSADAALAEQWESFRRRQVRPTFDRSQSA